MARTKEERRRKDNGKTKKDLQNTIQKTTDWATPSPIQDSKIQKILLIQLRHQVQHEQTNIHTEIQTY
jgi:hypothetical protein